MGLEKMDWGIRTLLHAGALAAGHSTSRKKGHLPAGALL